MAWPLGARVTQVATVPMIGKKRNSVPDTTATTAGCYLLGVA
jgi:hypothetical protein